MSSRDAELRVPGGRRLALIPAGACAHEVAAIVAALEQFAHDSAPAAFPAGSPEPAGWLLAARREATEREPGELVRDPWINT